MKITGKLRGLIISKLHEDLKKCRETIEECPFYVYVSEARSGGHEKDTGFWVSFQTSKHEHYFSSGPDSSVVAFAYCKLIGETCDGRVMMTVELRRSKAEPGRPERKWLDESYDWYNQDGRYVPFLMECSAWPLWNLLERGVDFDKIRMAVVEDVMNK